MYSVSDSEFSRFVFDTLSSLVMSDNYSVTGQKYIKSVNAVEKMLMFQVCGPVRKSVLEFLMTYEMLNKVCSWQLKKWKRFQVLVSMQQALSKIINNITVDILTIKAKMDISTGEASQILEYQLKKVSCVLTHYGLKELKQSFIFCHLPYPPSPNHLLSTLSLLLSSLAAWRQRDFDVVPDKGQFRWFPVYQCHMILSWGCAFLELLSVWPEPWKLDFLLSLLPFHVACVNETSPRLLWCDLVVYPLDPMSEGLDVQR